MERLEVREQVLDCRACELCKVGSGPIPFSGPSPVSVAVLGEAPGATEDSQGEPFVGVSGKLLRDALEGAGFDSANLFYFNSASCYPKGTPTPAQVNACSGNWAAQLELADPKWVLVLGNTALSTIRPGIKVTRARRHVFWQMERKWFVTFHPSAALRNGNTEKAMREDLQAFFSMTIADADHWPKYEWDSCIGCGTDMEDADEHDVEMALDAGAGYWCSDCTRLQFRI